MVQNIDNSQKRMMLMLEHMENAYSSRLEAVLNRLEKTTDEK